MFSRERSLVLDALSEKCGFKFEESDLSPALRQEITRLAQELSEMAPLRHGVFVLGQKARQEYASFRRVEYLGIVGLQVQSTLRNSQPTLLSISSSS